MCAFLVYQWYLNKVVKVNKQKKYQAQVTGRSYVFAFSKENLGKIPILNYSLQQTTYIN